MTTPHRKKVRKYEVNGVLEYAHCFSEVVTAKSPLDAQRIVRAKLGSLANPAIAEFQGGIVDKGILISYSHSSKTKE